MFDFDVAKHLPEAYRKFYFEWTDTPTPVHYIPKAGKYQRNPETGITQPVQNIPLPTMFPKEFDNCLLGGEMIVKGYYKSGPQIRKFPHFWVPTLKRTAVYSEILNKHMEVLATDRVIQLIHHYKGLDEYIMQVRQCFSKPLTFSHRNQISLTLTDYDFSLIFFNRPKHVTWKPNSH